MKSDRNDIKLMVETWRNLLLEQNKPFYSEFEDKEHAAHVYSSYNRYHDINDSIFNIIEKLEKIVHDARIYRHDDELCGRIIIADSNIDEYEIWYDFEGLNDDIYGKIEFKKINDDHEEGNALGTYKIIHTHNTTKGFGPLLYEIIVEWVSSKKSMLCCDRHDVSLLAQNVWKIYDVRSDIKKVQLDINDKESKHFNLKQLTPNDKSDDTSQDISIKHLGNSWKNSIFSKAISKDNMNTIKYLERISEYIDIDFMV